MRIINVLKFITFIIAICSLIFGTDKMSFINVIGIICLSGWILYLTIYVLVSIVYTILVIRSKD